MATSSTPMVQVNIPDHSALRVPKSLSLEEVRATLAAQGYAQVENAQATVDAQGNITFARPTGGVKGL
jgi:hypothetical protein